MSFSINFRVRYGCLLQQSGQFTYLIPKFHGGSDLLHKSPITRVIKDSCGEGAEIPSFPAKILQEKPPITFNVSRDFGFKGILNTDLPPVIEYPLGDVDIVCSVDNVLFDNLMRERI